MQPLNGIALGGFRSFGRDVQFIGPCSKVNLLVGPNNSGKSNILAFLMHHLAPVDAVLQNKYEAKLAFTQLDRHLGGASPFVFGVASPLSIYTGLLKEPNEVIQEAFDLYLNALQLHRGTDMLWFLHQSPTLNEKPAYTLPPELIHTIVNAAAKDGNMRRRLQYIWSQLTGSSGGGLEQDWIPGTINHLRMLAPPLPKVASVPAVRRVEMGAAPSGDSTRQDGTPDLSGRGLIERLAMLQNPGVHEQQNRSSFRDVNAFVREVTGNALAEIEIPYGRDTILVHMDGKSLPLESLGTGIHEVVILAAAATVTQNQVLCIEEPELHLHPVFQRKLLAYLERKTTNQYFISTHSAQMIDAKFASVFHVRLKDGQTYVRLASTPMQLRYICDELGYRSSDILQSNCVIWVEGPSDRIYLRHWIAAVDDGLIEGIHYSIMFYGGRLLAHLSAADPEVTDFISLSCINRNLVVMMDSDRKNSKCTINDTKLRVAKELTEAGGMAWVTAGREIENYFPTDMLQQCVDAVAPGFGSKTGNGRFDHALPIVNTGSRERADKVKVASKVADRQAELDVLDLREKITALVGFIRRANG